MGKRTKTPATIAALAAIYIVTGKLGLSLASINPSATAVWPPAGIALAALIIFGYRIWPGVFVGAFLVNLATAGSVLTSIGVATGNTLEAVVGAYLVKRFAGGRDAFSCAQNVFKFAILAGALSTMVSPSIGLTALSLGGFATWSHYGSIWLTWWLGDAVGVIIMAPLLILWTGTPRPLWNWARITEAAALLACLSFVSLLVFCRLFLPAASALPLPYLCIPVLIWSAFRFGQREAATAMLVLFLIASWGTSHGLGPFARESSNESLLLLQTFLGVVAVTIMALAAVLAERGRAEEQNRHLAVTDPLTGLVNYRRLLEVLASEIERSRRTGKSFSVLLLDLDGLKEINDRHGHVEGSRALCRVADVLRRNCRRVDTAARYGGDEFAIVLPEAKAREAGQIALRVCELVRSDLKPPPLSVSAGSAIYPRDGETIESLLAAADRSLYSKKIHLGEDARLRP